MLKRKNSRRKLLRHRKKRIKSQNRSPILKRKLKRRRKKKVAKVPLSQNKIRTPQRPKLQKKKLRKMLL